MVVETLRWVVCLRGFESCGKGGGAMERGGEKVDSGKCLNAGNLN